MAYKVVVEPDAQADIDKVFEYYLSVTDSIRFLLVYTMILSRLMML